MGKTPFFWMSPNNSYKQTDFVKKLLTLLKDSSPGCKETYLGKNLKMKTFPIQFITRFVETPCYCNFCLPEVEKDKKILLCPINFVHIVSVILLIFHHILVYKTRKILSKGHFGSALLN